MPDTQAGGAAPTAPFPPQQVGPVNVSYEPFTGAPNGIPVNDPTQLFRDFFAALQAGNVGPGGKPGAGGGGGGGRGGEGQLRGMLQGLVQQDLQNPYKPQLDPSIKARLDALFGQMGELGNQPLAGLDPETQAQMDTMLQTRLGDAQAEAEQARQKMIANLYGSGAERSDVGLRAGAMFEGETARTMQGIRSDDAGARLNLRLQNRAFRLQAYTAQADVLNTEQSGALGELGLQADAVTAERNRRAQMLDNIYNRQNERGIAALQARTQREGFMLGAYMQNLDRIQNAVLSREQMATDRYAADRNYQLQRRAQRDNRNAQIMGTIASIAMIAAFASDARLKVNVRELSQLKGYTWDWPVPMSTPNVGLLAQEVEEVMPFAVIERFGVRMVNYALVAAVQAEALRDVLRENAELRARLGEE